MSIRTAGLVLVFLVGCGGGGDDGGSIDAPRVIDSRPPIDSPATIDAGIDAAGGTFALTVKNYLAWCSVSVDGGAASGVSEQIVNVAPGAIPLTAVALAGFQIGTTPWHDTDGDAGGGEQGILTGSGQATQSATTETITNAPSCVWVCCEFIGGGGCPATDQCP